MKSNPNKKTLRIQSSSPLPGIRTLLHFLPTLIGLSNREDFSTPTVTVEMTGEPASVDAVAAVLGQAGIEFEECVADTS